MAFFQADPHPGNILILDENKIAFIDFGEVGTLTDNRLMQLGELLISISKQDIDRIIATLKAMEIVGESVDLEELEEDIADLVTHVTSSSVGDLDMNRLRIEVMNMAYHHDLRMPSYLTALMKALVTVEGVGKKLDPTFNFMEIVQPLAIKLFEERLKPDKVYKQLRRKYYRDIKPLGTLPADFQKLVRTAGEGKMQITMQVEFNASAKRQLNQLVSRLGISLIISAGLISCALIVTAGRGGGDILTWVGAGGFAAAVIGLAVFLVSVLRS
ncbi:MAG: AarF/ABC1/UbiB kinase family protein [Syntrophomonadaceae bacterium]|nr:AarF/ABC1/UbiB kinase family protein [Syntrophomonadaceae bacterium]